MKLYIWKYVPYVTDSYHNEGGAAVFADTLPAAKAVMRQHCAPFLAEMHDVYDGSYEQAVGEVAEALSRDPDILDLAGSSTPLPDPPLWIFPDAGCC